MAISKSYNPISWKLYYKINGLFEGQISSTNILEKIVLEIENDNIEVDELATKIKRASELLQICSVKLKASEEEVEKILKDLQF